MAQDLEGTSSVDADRVNDLYWNSELTVEAITEELDIGRGRVYALLEPIDAGVACRRCGERMVFSNRTRRDAGQAVCTNCGNEAQVDGRAHAGPGAWLSSLAGGVEWERWRSELAAIEPQRLAMVGGAAALGIIVGAAAALSLRNR